MAYKISNPNIFNPTNKVGIGVSIPFNNNSVFNQTYTTADQIKSNMVNFLLTNRDERVMNPNFGGDLQRSIFELSSQGGVETLQMKIKTILSTNFPSVNINSVNISPIYEQNAIRINIDYSIASTSQTINIVL